VAPVLPALRRVCADQDGQPRAWATDVHAEDRRMKTAKKAAPSAGRSVGRVSTGRPAGGSCARTRWNVRAGEKTRARQAADDRRDHPRDLRPGRRTRKRRAARAAPRSPGQPKTHKLKSPGGPHALRPAAVSRGLVQQGSSDGSAAHNPPGWAFFRGLRAASQCGAQYEKACVARFLRRRETQR